MAVSNFRRLAGFLLIAVLSDGALTCAQQRLIAEEVQVVSPATTALLQQMTQSADVIFAGEVVSVQRPAGYTGSGQDAAEGVVTVEFHVDEAVRGCVSGSVYALREWAGLWAAGDRYRVGERLLLFLRSPDTSGLASPVHGKEGAIPLRGGGVAPGPYDASAIAANWLVDLRWVQAQAMREVLPATSPSMSTPVNAPGRRPDRNEMAVPDALARPAGISPRNFARPAFLPPRNGLPRWTALPLMEDRSMPSLAQVLNLCREWASTPGRGNTEGFHVE